MSKTEAFSVSKIIESVVSFYDVTVKNLFGGRRTKDLVRARQILAYLFREELRMSYPAIGRKIGARDHTTAIYSYQKIKSILDSDSTLRQEIEDIKKIIKGDELCLLLRRQKAANELIAKKSSVKSSIESGWREVIKEEKFPIFSVASEREKSMLEEWRAGKTLDQIGKEWKLTRERIRQIITKAILREVGGKVNGGLEIDVEEFLKYEKGRHEIVRDQKLGRLKEKAKQKIQEPKRWSRYYTSCKECGTTMIPHDRRGLCERCYYGISRNDRKKIISERGNKCHKCGIDRVLSFREFGRDLYVTKTDKGDYSVLCRFCFLNLSGKKMFIAKKRKMLGE